MDKELAKRIEVLEKKAEAVKGMLAISEYMAVAPNLSEESVKAFYTLKGWIFDERR
jgi:hypothetical protein